MLRARDLAEAIDGGDMRPATVAAMLVEALAEREAAIGAFAHVDADRLLVDAARRDGREGALYGLPVAVKDIIDTREMPTSYGFDGFAGYRPMLDAAIVARLKRVGGVVQGKTVTTPFAFLDPAPTRNPHDPARTPGGSSSGSAAAIAAGLAAIALGSQTGGSTIRPASYCGVAAIKPSFRLLPTAGVKATSWSLDTLGVFAARVVDCAFALEALCGRPMPHGAQDYGTPRIGVMRQAYFGAPEPEAEAALAAAIRAFESLGVPVVDVPDPPAIAEGAAVFGVLYDHEIAVCLEPDRQLFGDRLPARLTAAIEAAAARDVAEYDAARRIARTARRAAARLFEGVDAIITHAAPGVAPADLSTTGDGRYNRMFTLLGAPALSVPGYRDPATGMPVGVQLVAPFARDAAALAIGAMLEAALARAAA